MKKINKKIIYFLFVFIFLLTWCSSQNENTEEKKMTQSKNKIDNLLINDYSNNSNLENNVKEKLSNKKIVNLIENGNSKKPTKVKNENQKLNKIVVKEKKIKDKQEKETEQISENQLDSFNNLNEKEEEKEIKKENSKKESFLMCWTKKSTQQALMNKDLWKTNNQDEKFLENNESLIFEKQDKIDKKVLNYFNEINQLFDEVEMMKSNLSNDLIYNNDYYEKDKNENNLANKQNIDLSKIITELKKIPNYYRLILNIKDKQKRQNYLNQLNDFLVKFLNVYNEIYNKNIKLWKSLKEN